MQYYYILIYFIINLCISTLTQFVSIIYFVRCCYVDSSEYYAVVLLLSNIECYYFVICIITYKILAFRRLRFRDIVLSSTDNSATHTLHTFNSIMNIHRLCYHRYTITHLFTTYKFHTKYLINVQTFLYFYFFLFIYYYSRSVVNTHTSAREAWRSGAANAARRACALGSASW